MRGCDGMKPMHDEEDAPGPLPPACPLPLPVPSGHSLTALLIPGLVNAHSRGSAFAAETNTLLLCRLW